MIYGFITVRASSSRLPNKCLLNFGNFTVLGHVIERLRSYSIKPVFAQPLIKMTTRLLKYLIHINANTLEAANITKLKDGMIAQNI